MSRKLSVEAVSNEDYLKPPPGSDRERDNKWYELVAGGSKWK